MTIPRRSGATTSDHDPHIAVCPKGNRFSLRRIDCPICGPADQKVLGLRGGKHQRWELGVETTIVRCASCGLIFANPFPTAMDPQGLYGDPQAYFQAHELSATIANNRRLAKALLERTGPFPRVLDVGAGRGDFLHAAQLEGIHDLVGLELSSAMASFAQQKFGFEVQTRTVEEFAELNERPFDAIVLNAVLEHVYNPSTFMAAVARVTKPGGWVYIDVPVEPNLLTIVGNASMRLRGKSAVFNLQPTWEPYHVFGYSPRTLDVLMEKHGYTIESVRVHSHPDVRHRGGDVKDHIRSFVATQINRVANLTGLASNMYVWGRRHASVEVSHLSHM